MKNSKINIIQICWYKVFPAESGGQKGIAFFYESLKKSCRVKFICSKNNEVDDVNILPILPLSKWQFLQWGSYKKILQLIRTHEEDYVIIEHPYYAFISLFKKKYRFKLIVHAHNIEYRRLKLLKKWYWWLVKLVEKHAFQKADRILCKTEEDKNYIEKEFGISAHKLFVLHYGTNLAALPSNKKEKRKWLQSKYQIDDDAKIFLFAGSFDYAPNQQALLHLINHLLPTIVEKIKEPFTIILCGTHLEEFIENKKINIPKGVIVAGFVENIVDYFLAADVFVNPVQYGEGIQTKNIEALANNCNVVCYSSMKNGLPLHLINKKLFLANDEADFNLSLQKAMQMNVETDVQFYNSYNWDWQVKKFLTEMEG